MTQLVWGIDLGGTKIEAAIIDPAEPGKALFRERIPTEAAYGYEHILNQVARLVRLVEEKSGCGRPVRIGIGTPGNTDPATGLLYHSNTQCLNGHPLQNDLAQVLGVEVITANDANCMALAEARWGAGRHLPTMMGLILGTGVGGGLVINGEIVNGRHGIAGEWGQIVLDPEGPESVYGTRGTIESYLAGPSLERYYQRLSGVARKLPEIAARAEEGGDPHAKATLDEFVKRFAQGVSILINLFDPHGIVVAGGVSNLKVIYSPRMRAALQKHVFQENFTTEILPPQLGDSAGVFGAAMLTV